MAITLGLHKPVVKISYTIIPGVKKFRALSMFMFWFSFATVILAVSFLKDVNSEFWKELSAKNQDRWQKRTLILLGVLTAVTLLFAMKGFTSGVMDPAAFSGSRLKLN